MGKVTADGKSAQLAARPRDVLLVSRAPARAAVRGGVRHQQMYRLPDMHARLQDDVDVGPRPGIHAVEQRRDEAVRLLPARLGCEAPREAGRWTLVRLSLR